METGYGMHTSPKESLILNVTTKNVPNVAQGLLGGKMIPG